MPLYQLTGRLRQVSPVSSFSALPASNNQTGDARITLDTFCNYVWDGTLWQPQALLDFGRGNQDYDDFEYDVATGLWTSSVTGAGAATNVFTTNIDANHFGIRELTTGTTTTGRTGFYLSIQSRQLGGANMAMEALVRFPTLSTSGERYSFRWGLGNFWNTSTTSPVSGLYFEYDEATSANWRCVATNAGTTTTQTTTTAVASGAWIKLKILYVSSGSASFYVNGTLVTGTPITTNFPTAILGFGYRILKSAGTTARTVLTDYFAQQTLLGSAR